MKLLVELSEKDFENMRAFDKALNNQLGAVYCGTNSMSVYFDYPPELCALLRPKAGNSYLSEEKLSELLNKLKSGKVIFELNSTKPQ
jgi:hypothetical protein